MVSEGVVAVVCAGKDAKGCAGHHICNKVCNAHCDFHFVPIKNTFCDVLQFYCVNAIAESDCLVQRGD